MLAQASDEQNPLKKKQNKPTLSTMPSILVTGTPLEEDVSSEQK